MLPLLRSRACASVRRPAALGASGAVQSAVLAAAAAPVRAASRPFVSAASSTCSSSCRCAAHGQRAFSSAATMASSAASSPFAYQSLMRSSARHSARTAISPSGGVSCFSTLESLGTETVVIADADPHARFVVVYTCTVCETRAAKSVSRQAYAEGVVLLRCDGCQKLHLFADRLGWFDDNSVDVETILAAKGVAVSRSSLNLAPEQLEQLQQLQRNMQAQQDERKAKLASKQDTIDPDTIKDEPSKITAESTAAAEASQTPPTSAPRND